MIALFTEEPERLYNRKSIFDSLVKAGAACAQCCSPTRIGSMLYHLRQDGIVEKLGTGVFQYRKTDDPSRDFVYAKRSRNQ